MTTRAKIATLSITALILCGIFSFVAFYKMDPVLLAEFSQELHNKNIIEGYEKKAHAGDPQAMLNLALAYEKGKLVPKNDALVTSWRKKAVEALERKANAGDVEAMFYLALAYREGKIVEKNDETAFKWLHNGAEKGHAKATYLLATMYENGEHVQSDLFQAGKLFLRATALGSEPALRYYKKLIDQCENANALNLNKENQAAKACIMTSDTNPKAQFTVGFLYKKGHLFERNDKESLKWFRQAAENGSLLAQVMLANAYFRAEGVEEDLVEAYSWSMLAEEQEWYTDQENITRQQNKLMFLDILEKQLTPAQKQQALKRAEEYRKKYETQKTPP